MDFWLNSLSNFMGNIFFAISGGVIALIASNRKILFSITPNKIGSKMDYHYTDPTMTSLVNEIYVFEEEKKNKGLRKFSKNPIIIYLNNNVEISSSWSTYIKVKKYKNIPIFYTSVIEISINGDFKRLNLMELLRFYLTKEKLNNKEVYKDFKKLLKICSYTDSFKIKFTNPSGRRSKCISLWEEKDEFGLKTIKPVMSKWHNNVRFTYASLLSILEIERESLLDQESTGDDFIDIKVNRQQVLFLLKYLKKRKYNKPKRPIDFYKIFKPNITPKITDLNFIAFRGTEIKKIQTENYNSFDSALEFRSPKKRIDEIGWFFKEKTKSNDTYYIFINRKDCIVIYGTIDNVRYGRISRMNFEILKELIFKWNKW